MIKYLLLANTFSKDILSTCLYVHISPHLDDHRSQEHPVFYFFHSIIRQSPSSMVLNTVHLLCFTPSSLNSDFLSLSLTLTPCVLVVILSCSGEIIKKDIKTLFIYLRKCFNPFRWVFCFSCSSKWHVFQAFFIHAFFSLHDLQLKKCKIMARHSFFFFLLHTTKMISS